MSEKLLIGAHTSAQGGVSNALLEGKEIGATCIQLFTSNQKRWQGKPFTKEIVEEWKETLKSTKISHVMSHDSYLINLGSKKEDILEKSRKAFKEELERCQDLNLSYLNFHPGAATEGTKEECLETIVKSLLELESLSDKGNTRLLLETTAGQGTAVGWRFEEIAYLVERTEKKIPIGVCIDTCHIFAAGYDIRTKEGWDKVLQEFDKVVGLKHLFAFHVNDSAKDLGTRVDRHADLGKGFIGLESFKVLMTHPKTKNLPKYLETPGGPPVWKQEIELLKSFTEH